MCMQSKEKKEDGETVTTIKAGSNFTFNPIVQVVQPKNSYIILIKVFCNEAESKCHQLFYNMFIVKVKWNDLSTPNN